MVDDSSHLMRMNQGRKRFLSIILSIQIIEIVSGCTKRPAMLKHTVPPPQGLPVVYTKVARNKPAKCIRSTRTYLDVSYSHKIASYAVHCKSVADDVIIEQDQEQPLRCAKEVWVAPLPSRMTRGNRAFEEEHRIRGYEVGPNRKTTMITIANLLQEVASNHVVSMWGRSDEGFASDPEMAKDGLIFVMTRMQIQIDEYPKWGDVVRFETWFGITGRMRASREWLVKDNSGNEIGRATSTWVTINMKTRRLGKVPDRTRERLAAFQYKEQNAFPDDKMQLKLPDLTSDEEVDVKIPQIARVSDMDMNGHINNVTYVNWILETIPEEVQDERQLYQIEIDYKNECTSGDLVHPLAEECDTPEVFNIESNGKYPMSFVHSLTRGDNDAKFTELVRARTIWL